MLVQTGGFPAGHTDPTPLPSRHTAQALRSPAAGNGNSPTDRAALAISISTAISLCAIKSAVFIYDRQIGLMTSTYQAIFPFYAPYIQEERD